MIEKKEICFVIMPIGPTTENHTENYWKTHFENFLKPLIEEKTDFDVQRSKPLRGDILREIITNLVTTPVVIADLTDHNPNVFWELGIRQSFKHGTITIAEEKTNLPFDVGSKGTLFYHPGNHIANMKFCNEFKNALKDCIEHPEKTDSLVLEILSGRGTLFEIFHRDESTRRLDAVLYECQHNLTCIEEVLQISRKNQKDPSKREIVTARLLTSAVTLLITNRYVDEREKFFDSGATYLSTLIAWSDMLNQWSNNPSGCEKWFIAAESEIREIIRSFKTNIENARKKITD